MFIELFEQIITAVGPVCAPLSVVMCAWLMRKTDENTKQLSCIDQKLTKNDVVMLRSRIKERGDSALETGHISEEKLAELESLYERYKEIGGNSFIDHLMERVRKLEVK